MGWQIAATAAIGALQYKQQGAIGKYNQSVQDRNALVLQGQADQIEKKAEFDVAQFNKTYEKVEGETTVAFAKSGVEIGTGSAYNIALSNALEKRLQENLIYYNSRVAAANKREEARFARIKGQMAKQESKLAQIQTVAQTGSNIYSMMNKPKG
jgi:histidine ammonia-lyase